MSGVLKRMVETAKKEVADDIVYDATKPIERISSGCLSFDLMSGGGFPRGRLSEVFGMEHSGKTSLLMQTMSDFLARNPDGSVVFWDYEDTWDPHYARTVFDLDDSRQNYVVMRPESLDDGFKVFDKLFDERKEDRVDLHIFDSIDSMKTKAILERGVGEKAVVGAHAKAITQVVTKVRHYCRVYNSTAVFLNQMRVNIQTNQFDVDRPGTGAGYKPQESHLTPGGYALRFYSSLRMKLKYGGLAEKRAAPGQTGETRNGNKIEIINIKNKVSTPFRKGETVYWFPIPNRQKGGWDRNYDTVQALTKMGLITQRSTKFIFSVENEEIFTNTGTLKESHEKLCSDPKARPYIDDLLKRYEPESLTGAELEVMPELQEASNPMAGMEGLPDLPETDEVLKASQIP